MKVLPHGASCRAHRRYRRALPPRFCARVWLWSCGSWHKRGQRDGKPTVRENRGKRNTSALRQHLRSQRVCSKSQNHRIIEYPALEGQHHPVQLAASLAQPMAGRDFHQRALGGCERWLCSNHECHFRHLQGMAGFEQSQVCAM